jgi:opacity protein-like surface antigen
MRPARRVWLAMLMLLLGPGGLLGAAGAAADERSQRGHDGQVGMSLGHLQSFELNPLAFQPMLEFRAGYQASESFLGRIDVGLAFSQINESAQESFEGAWWLGSHLAITLAWTPRLSRALYLTLGGSTGVWLSSLFGDDLTGLQQGQSAGSLKSYLEAADFSLSALAGLEWCLDSEWALTFELRYIWANGTLGPLDSQLAGLGAHIGFVYRLAAVDVDSP